jgi:hypothetical protein
MMKEENEHKMELKMFNDEDNYTLDIDIDIDELQQLGKIIELNP